ncbi:MAG: hypothetical protein ACO2O5_06485 [Candidatus Caldipriscus sp.]
MLIFLSYTHQFFMVPMRGGVRLAREGLVMSSLYRASGDFRVSKGNLRCLGRMGGVINWIISQSWYSGLVCGAWFSAMGITQYL